MAMCDVILSAVSPVPHANGYYTKSKLYEYVFGVLLSFKFYLYIICVGLITEILKSPDRLDGS